MRLYRRPDGSLITRDCSEARAIQVRDGISRLRSDFSLHHVAHASFIFVLGSLLGLLGILLWLAIVLTCRHRQWLPQVMEQLRPSKEQPDHRVPTRSRIQRAAQLQPLRFVRSTWAVLSLALCTVVAVSLLVVAGQVVVGVAHLAVEGKIATLFSTDEQIMGSIDSNID